MRVLVTNDDGVDSPGIRALARVLRTEGHDVSVVAPTDDRSGAAASIGPLHRAEPIPVSERRWAELPDVRVIGIERPPATAVYLTCIGAFGERPDCVVSGINPGANTGHLVLHSGTVGAALTAAGLGVPGVAVSMKWSDEGEYVWESAAAFAPAAVEWATAPDARALVLNVNVPNLPLTEIRGVRDAMLAPYGEFWVAAADLDGGDLRIEYQGARPEEAADRAGRDGEPATDAELLVDGYVTVTPLLGIVAAAPSGVAATLDPVLRTT
jgi:5'-nucleotidase